MKCTLCRSRANRPGECRRKAFTLLEVILALAVLAGGLAVLNEAVRISQQCGRVALDLTYAQMLCEKKMNEISSGVTPAEPVSDTPFGKPYDGWSYTVETGDLDVPGLTAVTVRVTQDLPPEREPVVYSLVRWLGETAMAAAADAANNSSNSSNSSSQNSSSSNGSSSGASGNSSSSGSSGGTSK